MAKKSKTQRAKASAARAKRKAEAKRAEELGLEVKQEEPAAKPEAPKKGLFKKSETAGSSSNSGKQADANKVVKKEKKPGRIRTFFKGVRSEMRRVTWPTRQDVLRWSGVVVAALVFFGVFVAVLDNVIVTPLLVAISSLSGLVA
ncbi:MULTISPECIES: preprotein translocase subunit SecE [unclassified Adlercreutzia]|uniref:preprotein translocase subunit SecE n=1 Tax=unclassified Adlercreutzia TaxID=2636013 RepID=UPI0013EDE4F6|nr:MULTISPECIES: preprotein translocase subunit SecE [unclassified Adlercreutzia]